MAGAGAGWMRLLPVGVATCLIASAALSGWPVNHDNAAYLQIGEALLDGAVPYVDYVELNPPLIHYAHTLPAALHALFGLSLQTSFVLSVSAWCLFSAAMLGWLLRATRLANASWSCVVTSGWLCFSLFVLCNNGFGQREHLFVLGFAPWLVGRHARHRDLELPLGRMLALGLGTGVFALLKPNLLAIVAVSELWLLYRSRRVAALWSVDALALAGAGIAYAVHFLLVPAAMREAFFERWVPLIAANYASYGTPLSEILASDIGVAVLAASLLTLAAWPFARRRPDAVRALLEALCLATLIAAAGFFAQAKGWYYHAYPCLGSALLLGSLLADPNAATTRRFGRDPTRVAAAIIASVSVGLALFAFHWGPRVQAEARAMADVIARDTRPGDTVAFIDTSVPPGSTALLYADRLPGVRYLPAFPIAFFHPAGAARGDAALEVEEERFLDEIGGDVLERRPALVLIRSDDCLACAPGFHIDAHLRAVGWTQRHLAAYEPIAEAAGFRIYALRARSR